MRWILWIPHKASDLCHVTYHVYGKALDLLVYRKTEDTVVCDVSMWEGDFSNMFHV